MRFLQLPVSAHRRVLHETMLAASGSVTGLIFHSGIPVHTLPGIPLRRAGFAVDIRLEKLAIHPLLHVVVCGDTGHLWREVQGLLSLVPEVDVSIGRLFTNEATLVNQVVMMAAEHHEVVQTRFAAVCPVLYMVPIDKPGVGAAREATALVSCA